MTQTQMDARIEGYAHLLVERGVGVQPGWQVLIRANPLARPLVEEVMRAVARRGAHALLCLSYGAPRVNLIVVDTAWALAAPDALSATSARSTRTGPGFRSASSMAGLILLTPGRYAYVIPGCYIGVS